MAVSNSCRSFLQKRDFRAIFARMCLVVSQVNLLDGTQKNLREARFPKVSCQRFSNYVELIKFAKGLLRD